MQFVVHSDHEIPLVNGLQAQLLHRFGVLESNHNLVAATLLDPQLKKLAFRDQTVNAMAFSLRINNVLDHLISSRSLPIKCLISAVTCKSIMDITCAVLS